MVSRKATVALLLVGLLLVTNAVWLYPGTGEAEYTYERSALEIENGTITYAMDDPGFTRWNDFEPVGCQRTDARTERACAFDLYLVDEGPVTVSSKQTVGAIRPDFVHLEGEYYRRIDRQNLSASPDARTHDVERVEPETVLEESAMNASRIAGPDPDREDVTLGTYVAATGESVTTTEPLKGDRIGTVYRHDGAYYTVLVTDRTVDTRGPDVLHDDLTRRMLMLAGIILVVVALDRAILHLRS